MPTHRHALLPTLLLAAPLAALLLAPAPALGAALDDIDLTAPETGNLRTLVTLFRDRRDELDGELGGLAETLEAAPSPLAALLILRQLPPELARHRGVRQPLQRRAARRGSRRSASPVQRPRHRSLAAALLGLSSVDVEPRTTLWLEGSTDRAEQESRDGIAGFESDASGALLGLNREIRPGFSLGIAGGRARADVTTPGWGRDDTDSDDYLAYSTLAVGAHRVDVLLSARTSETDRRRLLQIPRDGEIRQIVLDSTIDSDELLLSAGWSYDLELDGGWYLAPGLNLSHVRLETDDYLESGGGELGLIVETEDEEQLLASASVTVGRFALAGSWAFAPAAFLSLERALEADDTVTTATFRGTRFGFTARGYSVEETRISGGFSLGAYHLSGFGANLGVVHERQDDYRYTAVSATLELTF